MDWFEAIVLGIVQGLTEFLPISSSAHLSIVGQIFFKGHDPGAAFTAISQLGTETAVICYFAKDIGRIISHWFQSLFGKIPRNDPDARMGWLVIIGTVPIVAFGLIFKRQIETDLRNLWITVAMLAIVAVILLFADSSIARREGVNAYARRAAVTAPTASGGTRELNQLTWGHGILLGLAQACALIPGVSRSGATIAGGLFLGYSRPAAARYAFLLAIPAVFGSGLYELKDLAETDPNPAWGPILLATVIAFGIGLAVIHWLLKYISNHSFKVFVWYRLGLAAVVAGLLLTGVLGGN